MFLPSGPAWCCRCEWFSSLHQPIGTKTPLLPAPDCWLGSQINFSWFSNHNLQIKTRRKKNLQISVICRKSRIPSEMSDRYNLFTIIWRLLRFVLVNLLQLTWYQFTLTLDICHFRLVITFTGEDVKRNLKDRCYSTSVWGVGALPLHMRKKLT